jgi:hypothetical protein
LTGPRLKTHLCLATFAIDIFLLSLNSLQAEFFAFLPIMIARNKNAFRVTVLDRCYLGIEPLSRLCILVLLSFLRQALRVDILTEKENGSLLGGLHSLARPASATSDLSHRHDRYPRH